MVCSSCLWGRCKKLGMPGRDSLHGNGCTVDTKKALDCFSRAADMGVTHAMDALSKLYTEGKRLRWI